MPQHVTQMFTYYMLTFVEEKVCQNYAFVSTYIFLGLSLEVNFPLTIQLFVYIFLIIFHIVLCVNIVESPRTQRVKFGRAWPPNLCHSLPHLVRNIRHLWRLQAQQIVTHYKSINNLDLDSDVSLLAWPKETTIFFHFLFSMFFVKPMEFLTFFFVWNICVMISWCSSILSSSL